MIKDILTAAGVNFAQGRFLRMPEGTHAVYFDDITSTGADRGANASGLPRFYAHDVTVELYEPMPDDTVEEAIERELNAHGVEWNKQDRYWLKDLQRYQVVYEFSYTAKN